MLKKIILHKMPGDVGVMSMIISVFLVITLWGICLYEINVYYLKLNNTILTDGLQISNLSAPVIDEESLKDISFSTVHYDESTGSYVVKSLDGTEINVKLLQQETYNQFKELYDVNILGCRADAGIKDIQIAEFIIYNVEGDEVIVTRFLGDVMTQQIIPEGRGKVKAPNGVTINRTSVYSRVAFSYTDLFGFNHSNLKVQCCVAIRLADSGPSEYKDKED